MASVATPAAPWRCRYHGERPGVGTCTRCRSTLCEECATRVEGILHCRECLTRGTRRVAPRRWRSLSAVAPAALAGLAAWVALGASFYGLAALLALGAEWARR